MLLAALAIAACCACALLRKPACQTPYLIGERFLPGCELGIGPLESDNGAHTARILRAGLAAEKGEWSMKRFHMSLALLAILMAGLAGLLAPRAAAQTGSISGSIMDVNGKPWAEVVIRTLSDQGAKQETKTDSGGKFSVPNLRSGIYTVFVVFPPPNDKQAPYEAKCRVQGGEDAKVDLNFKDIVSKQGAEAQEQVKKEEEAKSKIEGLKAHFAAGNALIDQEKQAKIELQKAPADQRDRKSTRLNSSHQIISYAVFCLKKKKKKKKQKTKKKKKKQQT